MTECCATTYDGNGRYPKCKEKVTEGSMYCGYHKAERMARVRAMPQKSTIGDKYVGAAVLQTPDPRGTEGG